MKRKKILSLVTAAAVSLTMMIPVGVSADDTIWEAPSTPLKVSDKIVKVGAHAAASTMVDYIGGNMVAERASDYHTITNESTAAGKFEAAKQFTKLGVFGSSLNDDPDPYLWNYFYNRNVDANPSLGSLTDDEVYLASVASPMASDTTVVSELGTSYTLARRPEVLMDTAGGYDELIGKLPENTDSYKSNDYDPQSIDYKANDLSSFVDDMYNLAECITKSGKHGRYDTADYNTYDIAQDYEAAIKGLQLYVRSQIKSGKVKEKTVAIVDPTGVDTDGDGVMDKYKCFDSNTASGTAASCRAAEYCENTTKNIIDTEKLTKESDTFYYATPEQLCKADAILTGVQAQIVTTEEEFSAKLKAKLGSDATLPAIYATDPKGVFSIRANSVENICGVPIYQGFLYPEIINPVEATMYIYQKFWHISDQTKLVSLANANFANASLPEGVTADGSGYSEAKIQNMIDSGLKYYANNSDEFQGTKLQLTSNLDVSGYIDKVNLSKAKVSSISKKTYTGKAIVPSVTVKVDGKTLKKGEDYNVGCTSNVRPGIAKLVIQGVGRYTGSKTVTFQIAPKKAKVNSAKNYRSKKLKVSWSRQSYVSGYSVRIATNSKMTKGVKKATVKSWKTTSRTFTKLKKGKKYYVRVRAYKKASGKTIYGSWSSKKTVKIRR